MDSTPIDPETARHLATDPAVRAAVLATVTLDEAARTLRSRPGKPWCDAFLLHLTDGMDAQLGEGRVIGAGARQVVGVAPDWGVA